MHMLPIFKSIENFKNLIVTKFAEAIGEGFEVYDFLWISKVPEYKNGDDRTITYSQQSVRFEFQQKKVNRLGVVVTLKDDGVFLGLHNSETHFEVTDHEFAALLKFFVSFFVTYSKEQKTNVSNEAISIESVLFELTDLLRKETEELTAITVTKINQILHWGVSSFSIIGEDDKNTAVICEAKVLSDKITLRILKSADVGKPLQVKTVVIKNAALIQRLLAVYISINIIMF